MGHKSIIKINQVLHGYRRGHQMLANSCELSAESKRLLLFQSDLSGPLSLNSYDSYITGYPLSSENKYAFAKTWYAYEMKRPGCVWTQTFLIDFTDIGKLKDLSVLLSLFLRPSIDEYNYEYYNSAIEIDAEHTIQNLVDDKLLMKEYLAKALYINSDKPIFLQSDNPVEWESVVADLWSGQWPRLRRNFTFCTGALDLKDLNGKFFDLQIIPSSNLLQIKASSIFHYKASPLRIDFSSIFVKIFSINYRSELKNFLWLVGSDIPGTRKNYYYLISIFELYQSSYSTISEIIGFVNISFPKKSEARTLKKHLFGRKSVLLNRVSGVELLKIIIRSTSFDFIDLTELEINERILEYIKGGEISLLDFATLWSDSPKGRLDDNLWELGSFKYNDSINNLLRDDQNILDLVLSKYPEISELEWIWNSDLSFQKLVFEKIKDIETINWKTIVSHVLKTHSLIIIDIFYLRGKQVIELSLDWLNTSSQAQYFTYDWQVILKSNPNIVKKWLFINRKNCNYVVYLFTYKIFNHNILMSFNLPVDFWRRLARVAVSNQNIQIATSALSAGFQKKGDGGEWIISEVFQFIYDSASKSNLQYEQWNIIPKEEYFENENNWLDDVISIFSIKAKKRIVYDWDYCEILVRSLVNVYLKYPMNKQAFVQTLTEKNSFYRAIEYCQSFKKGRKFLLSLNTYSKSSSFKILNFQRSILGDFLR